MGSQQQQVFDELYPRTVNEQRKEQKQKGRS